MSENAEECMAGGEYHLGDFHNLAENDALYVYNAIDPNKMKAGVTGIFPLPREHCFSAWLYHMSNDNYLGLLQILINISITGGLSWEF
ncbi:MAG: hypothetical protein IPK57_10375 [Chitinophagaceae bacterium]|nr:hypothetical protein [Chitinophagaceae bacterium]